MLRNLWSGALCAGVLAFGATTASAFDLTEPAKDFETERQIAASQHRQILEQFGGAYDDPELAAYVDRVGQRVASSSDMPNNPFVFSVLNNSVVNAFTVGGGYVYVTRGILAAINSEAELAALLGHEIGHVTARHTATRESQMKKDRAASIGVGLLTGSLSAAILTEVIGGVARQAYSREQEYEADSLGVRSIFRAGYDPYAMSDMLGALDRQVALMGAMSGGQQQPSVPEWLQTHPQTDDRIRETLAQADESGVTRGSAEMGRDAHLDAIDGMLFGEDPAEGVVRDGRFVHTGVGIAFDIPAGYQTTNQGGIFIGIRDEASLFMLTGAKWPADRGLEEFALTAWYRLTEGGAGGLDGIEELSINGLDAIIATKELRKLFQTANLATVAYRVAEDEVYSLSFVVAGDLTAPIYDEFKGIAESFTVLTDAERAAIKPYRVQVVTAGSLDTAESLAGQMAFEDFQKERLEALNAENLTVETGDRVKLIVFE